MRAGLVVHPRSSELHAELGNVRLDREEYAWARNSFELALSIDAANTEALAGLGRVLLRFGAHEQAVGLIERAESMAGLDDPEHSLQVAAAFYQEGLFERCRDLLARAWHRVPDSAALIEALGYARDRLGDADGACRCLNMALALDPDRHSARVNLGHLLHDAGDREAALREFIKVPAADHRDPVAVSRVIQGLRAMEGPPPDRDLLRPWQERLDELVKADPVERLFAELGSTREVMGRYSDPYQLDLFFMRRGNGAD
ncbi:MAG: hypothetical protein J4G12_00125 [Gemmatimonadetes bacterium]|nr:hypothetical protein [Gemmatimonadota bacterium]